MVVVGIIPARFSSSRFPGKPLIDIGGKTMIRRVYEQASGAASLTDLMVATDDDRIFSEVKSFGGKVVMTASQHLNGTERCAEAARTLEMKADVIINIQGDEPFIDPGQIDLLSALFSNPECNIGTLIKHCDEESMALLPSVIKVATDKNLRALYFSRSPIPYYRDLKGSKQYFKHIGIYAFRTRVLYELVKLPPSALELAESLEQLRWLENGYTIHTAFTSSESISVDVPEDLIKVKQFLAKRN